MADETVVRNLSERYSVEVSKGMKNQYGWTVKVRGDVRDEVIKELVSIDKELRETFKEKEE